MEGETWSWGTAVRLRSISVGATGTPTFPRDCSLDLGCTLNFF